MKKNKKTGRIIRGVSFEPKLLLPAKKRAKENRQSFSAYINDLIFFDINVNNKLTTIESTKKARGR